jgi:hypothetical protein
MLEHFFLFLASFGKDVERMGRFSKVTTKFFLDTTLDPVFIPLEGRKIGSCCGWQMFLNRRNILVATRNEIFSSAFAKKYTFFLIFLCLIQSVSLKKM